MDFIHQLFSKEALPNLITQGGYLGLFIIIFAETGLLIGFLLPGDSLLVMAGLLIKTGVVDLDLVTLDILLIIAAVTGDAVGYWIGRRAGHSLYKRPDSRFFKKEHLRKTHEFYEKHGGKTIVLARFIPVIRTFAPVVAGAAEMGYRKFATFNIAGGILWILTTTLLGWLLGNVPGIDKYILLVIVLIVFISVLPPAIEILKSRRARLKLEATEARQTIRTK